MEWGVLIVVVLAAVAALASMRNDPLYTPKVRRRSYIVLAVYVLLLVIGVAALVSLPLESASASTTAFLLVAIFAYLAYAGIWILRLTPSHRPPPAFVLKPWTRLDVVMIVLLLVGTAGTVWGTFTP